jgi:hypothetical protein
MRPEDDPEVLHDLYITRHMKLAEIAAELSVSEHLVSRRLDCFGIPKRRSYHYPRTKSHRPSFDLQIRDPELAAALGLGGDV